MFRATAHTTWVVNLMNRRKIVLIGAGSASFSQGLVADLIMTGKPWQLGLVDIDPQALETAAGLSRRMIAARAADIVIEASTDRRNILPGADAVVATISVGGRRAWEADVFIPRKYGIFQPVGDTVMAGGISRAMRMIPALVAIAEDVVNLCPEATFINYSNPMTANCWALRKATGVNVIGLCHGVHDVTRELAALIDKPPAEVTALFLGVNHFTWIYDLRWKGADAWPLVRARLAQGVEADPFSWSLFTTYGAYPAVNDRHVSEFFPERFPQGRYYGKQLGVDAFSFERTIAHGDSQYAEMRAQATGAAPLDEAIFDRAEGEHEQLIEILDSLWADKRQIFSVNLPNNGAVPALPHDAILELPAAATARGFLALQMPPLPNSLLAPITRRVAAHALTVEAALTGDRKLWVEALLADGTVTEIATAEKLVAELLAFHQGHLPQFS
jgi:alpha-galactosidase